MKGRMVGSRVRLSLGLGHSLVGRRSDDQYIIAHPRSGSTWLRTVLVNIIYPDAKSNPDIFNTVIPGIAMRRIYQIKRLASPRLIMSHTWFRSGLPRVVYMVRDGRDALVSFYHYQITLKQVVEGLTFVDFADLYYQGAFGYLWHRDVESWLVDGRTELGDNLKVVRFEDMRADTVAVVSEVADFLGLRATRGQVDKAVQDAGLDRMRAIERDRWKKLDMGTPTGNTTFYRGGIAGQWQDYFSPAMHQKFVELSAKAMRLSGYET